MSHSDEAVDVATASPIPGYVVETSVNQRLLIDANRWVVTGLFSAVVFAVFFVLAWAGVIGITAAGPATLLLSVFIAGNLMHVPITTRTAEADRPRTGISFGEANPSRGAGQSVRP